VSVHVTSVPTVSVSVGVACVSVPSVPWTIKLNVPVVALPTDTVNAAPPAVGVNVSGVTPHVPGYPPAQLSVTVPLYPFDAVSVPCHVTF
jgi:hypothetical protein